MSIEETQENLPQRRGRPGPVAGAIVGGVGVIFAVLNAQSVQMHWLVSTTSTPLIVVIVTFALLGFVAGVLFARKRWRR